MTRTDRRRRNAAALAVSALVHVTGLGLLARYTPVFHPLWAPARDIQIDLAPTVPLAAPATQTAPAVTPRAVKHPSRRSDIQTTTPYPLQTRNAPQASRPPPPPPPPQPRPTPPPGRIVLPGAEPLGPTAGAPAWAGGLQGSPTERQNEGDDQGAGVRGALRTSVGCDDPDYYNLSKAERAVCLRQLGAEATIGRRQYVDAISSGKVRNEYDRAREACERLNHYATPLDSDREHSASAPTGKLSETLSAKLHC